jgi:hypothetical protein
MSAARKSSTSSGLFFLTRLAPEAFAEQSADPQHKAPRESGEIRSKLPCLTSTPMVSLYGLTNTTIAAPVTFGGGLFRFGVFELNLDTEELRSRLRIG